MNLASRYYFKVWETAMDKIRFPSQCVSVRYKHRHITDEKINTDSMQASVQILHCNELVVRKSC